MIRQRALERGFQAFSVNDELKLGTTETPPAGTAQHLSRNKAASGRPARRIELDAPAEIPAAEAWEQHFSSHREPAADVRETARHLMRVKKYDQLVGMIHSALRNNQAQPWMYEAMGIAMQANRAPKKEIERALMSAVDFSPHANSLMYVALYMDKVGLEERALSLLREVSSAYPFQPEPYAHGLATAQRLDDLEGIQWATLGILRQAWARDQQVIVENAFRAARATLIQLREDGQEEKATQYEQALGDALVRDVGVQISFSGDADVDLSVEEPGGTVCSLRSKRTTSGGVLGTDNFSLTSGDNNSAEATETYICPFGFAGRYRLSIRRVWGEVAANKVTVDIFTNFRTPQQKHIRQHIPLNDKNAVITFELPEGRRTEVLEDHLVAQAARTQVAVSRAILAQQLNRTSSSSAVRDFDASRINRLSAGRFLGRFGRQVGYQPVITSLPEGANLMATAVISADRRYVRITPTPMFSSIGAVRTFNYVSGAGETTEQGGGRGGMGGGMMGGGGMQGGQGNINVQQNNFAN